MAAIGRAAMAIAAVTILARALGFFRVVVFAHSVGAATCLGSAYYTANLVPNIIFEIVAGGALAGLVVPVLAGAVERGESDIAGHTASALLSWAVLLLTPLAVLTAVLAGPVMRLLYAPRVPGCDPAAVTGLGSRMLVVFAPQVVLYGVAVVLTGVLQAHRRFLGPAAAPLLSSLVVIAAYLLYAALSTGQTDALRGLSVPRELALSLGTTLGVAALALPLLVPMRRAGVRLRPALRFPAGVAPRVRALALSGAAVLVAQQASVAVVVHLAGSYAPRGGIVLYTLAWTLFLLPWAILAVPIATSAFPTLSARAEGGDHAGFATVVAGSTRAVLLCTAGAAAALVATAEPAARVLIQGTRGTPDPHELAAAVIAFAPGLIGYGLVAQLGRALFAADAGSVAAMAIGIGWVAVIVADLVVVPAAPRGRGVAALGIGNTVGMTVAGLLLLAALFARAGRAALAGLPRAAAAGALGAVVGGLAGARVAAAWSGSGLLASLGAVVLAGATVLAVFGAVVLVADGRDLRALLARRYAGV